MGTNASIKERRCRYNQNFVAFLNKIHLYNHLIDYRKLIFLKQDKKYINIFINKNGRLQSTILKIKYLYLKKILHPLLLCDFVPYLIDIL